MRTDTPVQIRLKDYRPSNYLIDTVHLDVALHPTRTKTVARLAMRPNPAHKGRLGALRKRKTQRRAVRPSGVQDRRFFADDREGAGQAIQPRNYHVL